MATKTLVTLEEFDRLRDDGLKHELNKGELITVTFPILGHNRVVRRIARLIERYLEQHPVGELIWSDTGFILSGPGEPVTLRGPDLAYIPLERAAQIPDQAKRIQGAAELTIEVVSPSDTPSELLEKTAEYLAAGGQVVWIVYPDEREVRIFEASGAIRILRSQDSIDAPSLLPGFTASVAAFFE